MQQQQEATGSCTPGRDDHQLEKEEEEEEEEEEEGSKLRRPTQTRVLACIGKNSSRNHNPVLFYIFNHLVLKGPFAFGHWLVAREQGRSRGYKIYILK